MCEELNKELDAGKEAAKVLVEHLKAMGADKCEIPIEDDDGCYLVKVTKTL